MKHEVRLTTQTTNKVFMLTVLKCSKYNARGQGWRKMLMKTSIRLAC